MLAASRLSKSRFIAGSQCHLRLWNDTHRPDLAAPVDDVAQFIFDTGHEVGELACKRYPGGRDVTADYLHFDDAIAETKQLMDGDASALFEAAFEHGGVVARADVLERLPGGGWRMIEVKSTTRVKDLFILDAAIQLWILRGAGSRRPRRLHPDAGHPASSERPSRRTRKRSFDCTASWKQASALLDGIGGDVRKMHDLIGHAEPPENRHRRSLP